MLLPLLPMIQMSFFTLESHSLCFQWLDLPAQVRIPKENQEKLHPYRTGQEIVTSVDKMAPLSYSNQQIPHLCPGISDLWISWHIPCGAGEQAQPNPWILDKTWEKDRPPGWSCSKLCRILSKKPLLRAAIYGKKGLHSPHLNGDKALENLHPGKFISMATNGAFQSWEIRNNK